MRHLTRLETTEANELENPEEGLSPSPPRTSSLFPAQERTQRPKKIMTAKHFIAVANSINKVLKGGGDAEGLRTLAENLADEFAEFNPHFSREKFLLVALSPA